MSFGWTANGFPGDAAAPATHGDDEHVLQGATPVTNTASNSVRDSLHSSVRSSIRRSMRGNDDASATGTVRKGLLLSGWHGKISRKADELFYRLGREVALGPKMTLVIAFLCVFMCAFGFANFRVESDAEALWIPVESESWANELLANSYFDEETEFAVILMEHPEEGGSLLTKEALDLLWQVSAQVEGLQTTSGNAFSDLCVKEPDGVTCSRPQMGMTRFWGNSFETYEATVFSDADVLEAVNVEQFPDGQAVAPFAIFGNSITYDETGMIVGARAMQQSWEVLQTEGDAALQEEVDEWQLVVQDFLEWQLAGWEPGFNAVYYTGRSLEDALSDNISGETLLFVATCILVTVLVATWIGRCRGSSVERRTWLGLAGVGTVVAGGLAAYGVCVGFGVPFTPLARLLPFVLVGIGVNDMFVIMAAFDQTDPRLAVEERVGLALKRCGMSVTYTSLTSFSAFLLGSVTSLPAVEYVCIYAATAILSDFVLLVSVFPALMAMDANRQRAGRMDWCCCCTNHAHLKEQVERGVTLSPTATPKPGPSAVGLDPSPARQHVQEQVNPLSKLSDRTASLAPESSASMVLPLPHPLEGGFNVQENSAPSEEPSEDRRHLSWVGRWMQDEYAPFLLSAKGKILVLLSTAGLLAAGIVGATKVSRGFDPLDLAPDDHFAREYTALARTYEVEHGMQLVPLEVYVREVDYTNPMVQAFIQDTNALMEEHTYFSGPVDSWVTSFAEWAAESTEYSESAGRTDGYRVYSDSETFYSALDAFLSNGTNGRFAADLVFDDAGEIEISKSTMFLVNITDSTSSVEALLDSRATMDLSPLDPRPFAVAGTFAFTEQHLVIYGDLITHFLLVLSVVAVLSLAVLGTVRVLLLVCVTVVIVDVELLGFVYHLGLQVNGITVIELAMAVGLVVYYVVHVARSYLQQDPCMATDIRMGRALGDIGPSVAVGAMTTLVGIVPMAFASNVVFRGLFKMFLIIIIFGFFHGLAFVPVALSLLPCSKLAKAEGSLEDVEGTTPEMVGAPPTDDEEGALEAFESWTVSAGVRVDPDVRAGADVVHGVRNTRPIPDDVGAGYYVRHASKDSDFHSYPGCEDGVTGTYPALTSPGSPPSGAGTGKAPGKSPFLRSLPVSPVPTDEGYDTNDTNDEYIPPVSRRRASQLESETAEEDEPGVVPPVPRTSKRWSNTGKEQGMQPLLGEGAVGPKIVLSATPQQPTGAQQQHQQEQEEEEAETWKADEVS